MPETMAVPRKEGERARGAALGPPDRYHNLKEHNKLEMPNPVAHRVDSDEANKTRFFNARASSYDQLPNPWRPLEIDPKMGFRRDNSRYLVPHSLIP